MSAPLSLRVCCMAAMAPALTEAASHSHIKLSDTPPPLSPDSPSPLVNGAGLGAKSQNGNATAAERKRSGKQSLVGFTSHLTLHQLQQAHKQGLLKPVGCNQITAANLKNLKFIQKIQTISREKETILPVLNQNGNHKHFDTCEKMNKLVPVNNANDAIKQVDQHLKSTYNYKETCQDVKQSDVCANDNSEKTNHNGPANNVTNKHLKSANVTGGLKLTPDQSSSSVDQTDTKMVASMGNDPDVNVPDISKPGIEQVDVQRDHVNEKDSTESQKTDLHDEVSRKQHSLERRTQHLLRRLRRIQGRQLESHARHQLSSYVSFQNSNLQTVAKSIKSNSNVDLKTDLFQSEDVKSLSTAALVNLVRRLQSSNQSSLPLGQRLVNQTKNDKDVIQQGVLSMDEEMCAESSRVSGHLGMNLKHMQSAIDSDATESSSGGESCDEDDIYFDRECKGAQVPLHRRAEWKWATERANVASRWTWLQAQVSDLEYRIRQQSEIFKHIRHTKGSVVLGEPQILEGLSSQLKQGRIPMEGHKLSPIDAKIANLQKKNEVSPCNISTIVMNVNMQANKLTKSLGNCYSPLQTSSENKLTGQNHSTKQGLNGVISASTSGAGHSGVMGSSGDDNSTAPSATPLVGPSGDASSAVTTSEITSPSPPDLTCQAARCRPVRSYRKRKLLRTAGLHQLSRKAARLSTVKCQCYPPIDYCPMCGGRYNNTQHVDPDTQPTQERVCILDPAFHPVLSFNQEIPLPVHFEALLKSGEWQNKPPPKNAKGLSAERRRQKMMMSSVRDRANKKTKYAKSAAAALLSSAKLRNKYERRTPTKSRGNGLSITPKKKSGERRYARTDLKRRRAAQLAIAAMKRNEENLSMSLSDGMILDSRSSPHGSLSGSCPPSTLKEMKEAAWRRRRESAYDINNIVIPYSMAASTRVEKLQYKEIVTPKWRDLMEEPTDKSEETTAPEVEPEQSDQQEHEEAKVEQKQETSANNSPTNVEMVMDEDEVENISEESYIERHLICEVQERKRFTSFIQYPSRRSRGSRGEDRCPPTPDPLSPDSSLNESQFVASGLSSNPVVAQSIRDEAFRRRSSSASRRTSISQSEEHVQQIEMIEPSLVDPWPERTFPLSEEEYEQMKLVQPPPIPQKRRRIPSSRMSLLSEFGGGGTNLSKPDDVTPGSSHPCSPLPSSSSGSVVGEDPNDPEWTIVNGDTTPKQPVVLRLGKR